MWIPQQAGNATLWLAPEVREFIQYLHKGCPEIGWEGDENLALYWNREEERWEIWRLCPDGVMRMILRSRPHAKLDKGVLHMLRDMDSRRVDVVAKIEAHNRALERDRERQATERNEQIADKLAWALKKDGVE